MLICRSHLAFSLVQHPIFKLFVYLLNPNYKLPSRQEISELIQKYGSDQESKLKCEIEEQILTNKIAITSDFWTSLGNDSYLSLTAQWLDSNFNLQKKLLAIVPFPYKSHDSGSITKTIKMELLKIGLQIENVIGIVTDNASNFQKAMKENFPSIQHIHCFAHTIQIVITDVFNAIMNPKTKNKVRKSNQSTTPGILETNTTLENLREEEVVKNIFIVMKKCREIVTFIHRSPKAVLELRDMGDFKMPKLDVATRWASTYFMIQSLNRIQPLVDAWMHSSNTSSATKPSIEEWTLLRQIQCVLQPIAEIQIEMEGSMHGLSTLNHAIVMIKQKLLDNVLVYKSIKGEVEYLYQETEIRQEILYLRDQILQKIEKRFFNTKDVNSAQLQGFYNAKLLSNKVQMMAIFLDPRLKHLIHFSDAEKDYIYTQVRQELYERIFKRLSKEKESGWMSPDLQSPIEWIQSNSGIYIYIYISS